MNSKSKVDFQPDPFVVKDYENRPLTKMSIQNTTPPPLGSPIRKRKKNVEIFVVVDAIGLETDFTLETNRKRVKEKDTGCATHFVVS